MGLLAQLWNDLFAVLNRYETGQITMPTLKEYFTNNLALLHLVVEGSRDII